MILPIYIYGQPVLRKVAKVIDVENYPNLNELIDNMFETMYDAEGIGLAAPQVGLDQRIFVVDLDNVSDEDTPEFKGFKKVFINAQIIERDGDIEMIEEGCLSIPGIHEKVPRESKITIKYLDENLEEKVEEYSDFFARVIQHEYDHIEGTLFVDKISPLRKRMVKNKLQSMEKGKINCHYRIKTL